MAAELHSILGISKQPIGLRTKIAGARARVVPAVEPPKQMVPLGIIKPAPRFAVLASSRGLTGEQTCCPGAVVCLQT